MRITVIGATGMVGSRVTAEAVHRRHQVTAVSRRPPEPPHTVAGATALAADFTAAGVPDAALAGADALVLSVPPVLDDTAAVTGSMHRLLDAAAGAEVRVLVVAEPDRCAPPATRPGSPSTTRRSCPRRGAPSPARASRNCAPARATRTGAGRI
ncbi:NAD(P)H-binding protein [Streptomyces sp. NPDC006307]|uniref:NAD(P)H-binding protein n=1 Tax=Streptomyces sp. NPDC006307 TaxID=3156748 RepID=UPI0033B6A0DC